MPEKDSTLLSYGISIILTLFGFLLGLLRYIWVRYTKGVKKEMAAHAVRIDRNEKKIEAIEKSFPVEIASLKQFAIDSFTSRTEFREKIQHIEDTSTARYHDLKGDITELKDNNKEIKDFLTKMRSDTIEKQEREIAAKDKRIQELIDGSKR